MRISRKELAAMSPSERDRMIARLAHPEHEGNLSMVTTRQHFPTTDDLPQQIRCEVVWHRGAEEVRLSTDAHVDDVVHTVRCLLAACAACTAQDG